MLWPLVLPFKVTVVILAAIVVAAAVLAPVVKWKRRKTFANAALLAVVAFIPAMIAITKIADTYRFGIFHYDAFPDVNDFRIERYLPTKARQITVDKFAQGHRARYSISESDLRAYLDGLWDKYGARSAISRDALNSDSYVGMDQFEQFSDLGWPVLEKAIELHSPMQDNGAGATYYFDRQTGTAYHRAGYW